MSNPYDPYQPTGQPGDHQQGQPSYGQPVYGDQSQGYGQQQYGYDQSLYGQAQYGAPGAYGGGQPGFDPMLTQAADKKATQALIASIVGFLCCGILGIVGIVLGVQSKKELEAAGRTETGKSLAAIIIGALAIVVNTGLMIYRFSGK